MCKHWILAICSQLSGHPDSLLSTLFSQELFIWIKDMFSTGITSFFLCLLQWGFNALRWAELNTLEVGISLRVPRQPVQGTLILLSDVPSHIKEQFQLEWLALMEKLICGLWSRSPAGFPVHCSCAGRICATGLFQFQPQHLCKTQQPSVFCKEGCLFLWIWAFCLFNCSDF